MVEENIMFQQLQKIYREKVCRIKVFLPNFRKFGQKILCIPKYCLILHLCTRQHLLYLMKPAARFNFL